MPMSAPDGGSGYTLFDTEFGTCGVAWRGEAIVRFQLPERDPGVTERRLIATARDAQRAEPPPRIGEAIDLLRRYFTGEPTDLAAIDIAMPNVGDFQRRIYDRTRALRWGETATYGELARRAGMPGAAQAVGQAMGRNPVPIIVPCHRVLAQARGIGGFSAFGGAATKTRLLAMEGVHLLQTPMLPGLFDEPG